MNGVKLVRTDKNGTKYFESSICPKCCGTGYINGYEHVEGGVCFKCMGSGCFDHHWKEYTPKYASKLEAQRKAREERALPSMREHLGLSADGKCFLVMDRTFGRNNELKAAGARFNGAWWYFAAKVDGWDTEEVDATPYVENHFEKKYCKWGDDFKSNLKDIQAAFYKARRTEANSKVETSHLGNIGDKVEILVTLERAFHFEATDYMGNNCLKFGYKMKDAEGHILVWITEKSVSELLKETNSEFHCDGSQQEKNAAGRTFTLKGTIKAHQEREGLKETRLIRCRFIEK